MGSRTACGEALTAISRISGVVPYSKLRHTLPMMVCCAKGNESWLKTHTGTLKLLASFPEHLDKIALNDIANFAKLASALDLPSALPLRLVEPRIMALLATCDFNDLLSLATSFAHAKFYSPDIWEAILSRLAVALNSPSTTPVSPCDFVSLALAMSSARQLRPVKALRAMRPLMRRSVKALSPASAFDAVIAYSRWPGVLTLQDRTWLNSAITTALSEVTPPDHEHHKVVLAEAMDALREFVTEESWRRLFKSGPRGTLPNERMILLRILAKCRHDLYKGFAANLIQGLEAVEDPHPPGQMLVATLYQLVKSGHVSDATAVYSIFEQSLVPSLRDLDAALLPHLVYVLERLSGKSEGVVSLWLGLEQRILKQPAQETGYSASELVWILEGFFYSKAVFDWAEVELAERVNQLRPQEVVALKRLIEAKEFNELLGGGGDQGGSMLASIVGEVLERINVDADKREEETYELPDNVKQVLEEGFPNMVSFNHRSVDCELTYNGKPLGVIFARESDVHPATESLKTQLTLRYKRAFIEFEQNAVVVDLAQSQSPDEFRATLEEELQGLADIKKALGEVQQQSGTHVPETKKQRREQTLPATPGLPEPLAKVTKKGNSALRNWKPVEAGTGDRALARLPWQPVEVAKFVKPTLKQGKSKK